HTVSRSMSRRLTGYVWYPLGRRKRPIAQRCASSPGARGSLKGWLIGAPYGAARRSPRGGASALGAARRRSLEPPTALRAGPPEGERAPWERPGGAHWSPLRRCAPVPPRGSERLGSGPAALIGAPYGAARRSPRGGASALGAARRRSLLDRPRNLVARARPHDHLVRHELDDRAQPH